MELSHNYWRYRSKADPALKEVIVFQRRQPQKYWQGMQQNKGGTDGLQPP